LIICKPDNGDVKQKNQDFHCIWGLIWIALIRGKILSLREILAQRDAGLWYQSGNPESLVKAISILLVDEEKRKKMAGNARRLVEERYDRNKTYPSIIPFFEKVIETQ